MRKDLKKKEQAVRKRYIEFIICVLKLNKFKMTFKVYEHATRVTTFF